MEEYLGRLYGLVVSIEGLVSASACNEATHLIDHGEGPEAMRSLAGSIVHDDRRVPRWVVDALRELAGGMIAPEHWPPNLDGYVDDAAL